MATSNTTLILSAFGNEKIAVIKVIKDFLGLGLAEAKELVESAPCTILKNAPREQADDLRRQLEGHGADVQAEANSTFDYEGIVLKHRFSQDDPLHNLGLMIERAQTLIMAMDEISDPSVENLDGRLVSCLRVEIADIYELHTAMLVAADARNGGAS